MNHPEQVDSIPAAKRAGKWNVSVYVPAAVKVCLQAEKERTGLPYTAILAATFDRVDPMELHSWLHQDQPATSGPRTGMPPSETWGRRGGGDQLQLRMTTEQREWLDGQVAYFHAPSRSALVAAVLRLGLPKG